MHGQGLVTAVGVALAAWLLLPTYSGTHRAAAVADALSAAHSPAPVEQRTLCAPHGPCQTVLEAVRDHITNWPEFAAANNLTGWGDDPAVPPCLYTGVTCDADAQLQSLSLACQQCVVQAEGTLAAEVAQSLTLATLDMQQHKLGGPLPAEYGHTGSLPSLLHLVLSYNELSGSIPEEWSNAEALPRLSLLGLGFNRLSGTLPQNWLLPSLLILRLNSNIFSGPLPPTWGTNRSLPHLRVASLQHNALTSTLPLEWAGEGVMAQLEQLYLQENQLTGGLPPEWGLREGGLPALRVLNISNNPLGGTLPDQWHQQRSFPSIRTLALSNAGLQGTLPPSWHCQDPNTCGMPQLQNLWLDGNNLSGPVPPSWATHTGLQAVYIRPGNELLCRPPNITFPFRMCTAISLDCPDTEGLGGCAAPEDCPDAVQLPDCDTAMYPELLPSGGDPAAAHPTTPGSTATGGSTSEGGDGSRTEGGSNVASIVGGVVGGLAAVATVALATLLLLRRKRRRRKRKRELPFYSDASDEVEKALQASGSAFGGTSPCIPPNTPRTTPPRPLADSSSDSVNVGVPLSPFAAAAAEAEMTGSSTAGTVPAGPPQPGQSGLGPAGNAGPSAAVADDEELAADLERRMEIELAALGAAPEQRTPRSHATSVNALSRRNQGGELRLPPSQSSSESDSRDRQWEDSVPLSDWQITPSEIQIAQRPDGTDWELGTGAFGKVYKAVRHGAQPVAVKVLTAVETESRYQGEEDFKREIAILRACRDPNIVSFLGASLQRDSIMLVTEYCNGGNLTRNIMAGRVTWYRRGKKIALDVARGLTYLHSRRIVHFDLKSPNILMSRDGTAKISDVGMAKIIAREYSGVTGNVGTLAWAAPEMLLGARCTEKADIYSYGVVLWEICTGMTPLRGQLRDVSVPEECPIEVRDLVLDCLSPSPRKRPTAVEIVERLQNMPDPKPPPTSAPNLRAESSPINRRQQRSERQIFRRSAPWLPGASSATSAAPGSPPRPAREGAPHLPASPARAAVSRGSSEPRTSEESAFSLLDPDPEGAQLLMPAAYISPGRRASAAWAAPQQASSGSALNLHLPGLPTALFSAAERLRQHAPSPGLQRASSSPLISGLNVGSRQLPAPYAMRAGGIAHVTQGLGSRPPRPRQPPVQRRRSLDEAAVRLLAHRHGGMSGQPATFNEQQAGTLAAAGTAAVPLAEQAAASQHSVRPFWAQRQAGRRASSLQQQLPLQQGLGSVGEEGVEEAPHRHWQVLPSHQVVADVWMANEVCAGQHLGEQQLLAQAHKSGRQGLAVQQHTQQKALVDQQQKQSRLLGDQQLKDWDKLAMQHREERLSLRSRQRQEQEEEGKREQDPHQQQELRQEALTQPAQRHVTTPPSVPADAGASPFSIAAASFAVEPASPAAAPAEATAEGAAHVPATGMVSAFLRSSSEAASSPRYNSPFALVPPPTNQELERTRSKQICSA